MDSRPSAGPMHTARPWKAAVSLLSAARRRSIAGPRRVRSVAIAAGGTSSGAAALGGQDRQPDHATELGVGHPCGRLALPERSSEADLPDRVIVIHVPGS